MAGQARHRSPAGSVPASQIRYTGEGESGTNYYSFWLWGIKKGRNRSVREPISADWKDTNANPPDWYSAARASQSPT